MPKTILRALAVLLLALTVPLQGMAAVTGGVCMALGQHHDAAPDQHQAHAHDDGGAKHGDHGGKKSHCGPCTACCASASITGPLSFALLSLPSDTPYVFLKSFSSGIQPDGLFRPPLAV